MLVCRASVSEGLTSGQHFVSDVANSAYANCILHEEGRWLSKPFVGTRSQPQPRHFHLSRELGVMEAQNVDTWLRVPGHSFTTQTCKVSPLLLKCLICDRAAPCAGQSEGGNFPSRGRSVDVLHVGDHVALQVREVQHPAVVLYFSKNHKIESVRLRFQGYDESADIWVDARALVRVQPWQEDPVCCPCCAQSGGATHHSECQSRPLAARRGRPPRQCQRCGIRFTGRRCTSCGAWV